MILHPPPVLAWYVVNRKDTDIHSGCCRALRTGPLSRFFHNTPLLKTLRLPFSELLFFKLFSFPHWGKKNGNGVMFHCWQKKKQRLLRKKWARWSALFTGQPIGDVKSVCDRLPVADCLHYPSVSFLPVYICIVYLYLPALVSAVKSYFCFKYSYKHYDNFSHPLPLVCTRKTFRIPGSADCCFISDFLSTCLISKNPNKPFVLNSQWSVNSLLKIVFLSSFYPQRSQVCIYGLAYIVMLKAFSPAAHRDPTLDPDEWESTQIFCSWFSFFFFFWWGGINWYF